MKAFLFIPALALLAGCTADGAVESSTAAEANAETDALAGWTPGTPVSCVNLRELRGNRSIGEGAILFEGRGNNLVYLNRPAGGCPTLGPGQALRTNTTGTQLCRGDIVDVIDTATGIQNGGCGLGDFVPYTR